MRGNTYQFALIGLGVVVTGIFGIYLYRELNPEYKIYQKDYIDLEKFRSEYTGEPPPAFSEGIKQIVLVQPNNAPAEVDRCISCHVALQFEHFSPTILKRNINGVIVRDEYGIPLTEKNPNYIWSKLDEKIAQLNSSGSITDHKRAETLLSLKTAKVGKHVYDVTKVLRMHPLIGKETRPFEFHPIEDYGCTSCHSGNGRGLTTEKAHGPVFDGQYEVEFMGPVPTFVESDPKNDPQFSKIFNHKPAHELLFQTTPILLGSLMEAKCVQCHQSSQDVLKDSIQKNQSLLNEQEEQYKLSKNSFQEEKAALISLIQLKERLNSDGYEKTLAELERLSHDYTLPKNILEGYAAQLNYLRKKNKQEILSDLNEKVNTIVGTQNLAKILESLILEDSNRTSMLQSLDSFIEEHRFNSEGTLFAKSRSVNQSRSNLEKLKDKLGNFDRSALESFHTDIDFLTKNYHAGKDLYISQACYACHRIAGFSRGGIGPELTLSGQNYPWYLKESIVWPQADLKTSTMPNYKMDHEEVEDLMTFMLSLNGKTKAISETGYKISLSNWEKGEKLPWEKPISPTQIQDLRFGMTVFATEGCSACHRLKGFESNVGFVAEKESSEKKNSDKLIADKEWFRRMFPEEISGSELADKIEKYSAEIDSKISDNIRENSILEEIYQVNPQAIDALYANFRYAERAKNDLFSKFEEEIDNEESRKKLLSKKKAWSDRVHRVKMIYIQEYGLGRLIGPRPNWSGVYRSDQWLMQHFWNPQALVARSIMPVFPFDNTKFYSLVNMLNVLGKKNRDEVRRIWEREGFSPSRAYEIFCAQCHGDLRQGNGPIAEWIYPIPKNLRNSDFLRNLTKAKAVESIVHGVKGGPMPPWGETPSDKENYDGIPVMSRDEINDLVDWLYSSLRGAKVIESDEDVPKWQYKPKDVIKELEDEGSSKKFLENKYLKNSSSLLNSLTAGSEYYVSLKPYLNESENSQITEIFDIVPDPYGTKGEYWYYIKPGYYTNENIEKGRIYFEEYCATCHGKEGDGAGARAATMKEAKPRMLTNLDWLDSRDDLRLLRSIKYGVQGTSMTPWGDQTNALQRMQLVMFIRTLSKQSKLREQLFSSLYQAFRESEIAIERSRIANYPLIAQMKNDLDELKKEKERLNISVAKGEISPAAAVKTYEKELNLTLALNQASLADKALLDLRELLNEERAIYENLGVSIVNKGINEDIFNIFDQVVILNNQKFRYEDNQLYLNLDDKKNRRIIDTQNKVISEIEIKENQLIKEEQLALGKIASSERTAELKEIKANLASFVALKNSLISGFQEAARLREKQIETFKIYEKSRKRT